MVYVVLYKIQVNKLKDYVNGLQINVLISKNLYNNSNK